LRGWSVSWGVSRWPRSTSLTKVACLARKARKYVQVMYYALEVAGVVVATLLLLNQARVGWFLSLGVAAGPILGYVLSRGPGLPDYTDDIGNWTEPLGVISLIVEGILLILAAASLVASRRGGRAAD